MDFLSNSHRSILRSVLAASLPIAVGAVQWMFWDALKPYAYILLYPTIFFVPMIGGLWAGVAATMMSALIVWFAFLPPYLSFRLEESGPIPSLVLFAVMGIVFSIFHERMSQLRRQQIVREGEQRFSIMFRDAPVALIGFQQHDGRIVEVSEGFERMAGYARNEIVGRTTAELGLWVEADLLDAAQPKTGATLHREIGYRSKSGEVRDAAVSVIQIEMEGRAVLLVMLADTTERKRAEAKLQQSEDRFRILVESGIQGLLVVNEQGQIVLTSRALETMFGYPPKELVGQTIECLLPERVRTHHVGERAAFARQPAVRTMGAGRDLLGRRKDGSEFPVEVGLGPIRFGEQSLVLATVVDISSRKRAEAALIRSEEQLRRFVEQAPVSIAMFDRNMHYIVTSRRWISEYGRGHQDLVGLCHYDVHPDLPELWHEIHRRGLDGEMLENDDDQWTQGDGTHNWLRWAVHPWRDHNDEVGGIIIFAEDISARRLAEEQIRRLNAELEQRVTERTTELRAANRELEAFTYAVAHDLRAPLRAMNGFSTALKEDYPALFVGDAAAFLKEIIEGSRRMAELIDGLLALSRSTQGELERQGVDLTEMASRIRTELVRSEPERKVQWKIQNGLATRGDPRMLEVVLYNLLGNAWKYTARTPDARIEVLATVENDERHFCIDDNGAGFDMNYADKLFAPFQRLHRRDEFPGIGIGLATVQRIIHRHGGHIYARSSPGEGAHFCFTIESSHTTLSRDAHA